jgi:katanin p60 ATPase-containing subunit A1
MNVKKALSEETEVVKQLDADKRAFKDNPIGRRPPSPPISTKSSFVFQPSDEYPTSSGSSFDDPDVWRPPSRDTRRPARGGQVGNRISQHDSKWARGATTKTSAAGRGAKAGGVKSKVNSGARTSTPVKKGGASGKSSKTDTTVSFNFMKHSVGLHFLYNILLFQKVIPKDYLFCGLGQILIMCLIL